MLRRMIFASGGTIIWLVNQSRSVFTVIVDEVIKWKHFPRNCPLWEESTGHEWVVHKGLWHGALVFSFNCAWTNGWVSNRDAGDLRRHRGNYDVNVMLQQLVKPALKFESAGLLSKQLCKILCTTGKMRMNIYLHKNKYFAWLNINIQTTSINLISWAVQIHTMKRNRDIFCTFFIISFNELEISPFMLQIKIYFRNI